MAQWLTEDEQQVQNEHKSSYRCPLARHTKVIESVLQEAFSDAGANIFSSLLDA